MIGRMEVIRIITLYRAKLEGNVATREPQRIPKISIRLRCP